MPMIADDLSRDVLIHICKDRTLFYRRRGAKVFNGVALPIFSVNDEHEANALLVLVGTNCNTRHPQLPGDRTWFKLFNGVGGHSPVLELEHTDEASDYLREAYAKLKQRTAA